MERGRVLKTLCFILCLCVFSQTANSQTQERYPTDAELSASFCMRILDDTVKYLQSADLSETGKKNLISKQYLQKKLNLFVVTSIQRLDHNGMQMMLASKISGNNAVDAMYEGIRNCVNSASESSKNKAELMDKFDICAKEQTKLYALDKCDSLSFLPY